MKTKLAFAIAILALAIIACEASATPIPNAPQSLAADPIQTRTPKAKKAEATPTPDIGMTLAVAHAHETRSAQTADAAELQVAAITAEANRISSQATSDSIGATLQVASITQEADRQAFLVRSWTATAAETAIPVTRTQNALLIAGMKTQQSIVATAQLMTQQAPTAIVAMAKAQAEAKYADRNAAAGVWGMIGLGAAGLAIAAAVVYRIFESVIALRRQLEMEAEALKPAPEPVRELPKINRGMVVSQVYNADAGYVSQIGECWPCKPNPDDPEYSDQFHELAVHAVRNNGRLIIRAFEGDESSWTRDDFAKWRAWAQAHKPPYVTSGAGSGSGKSYYATEEAMKIFRAHVEREDLPLQIEFKSADPKIADLAAHTRVPHTPAGGGGAAADGFEPLPGGAK